MQSGTPASSNRTRRTQAAWVSQLLSGLLLLATWGYLCLWITAMTGALLVPWDILPGRPPTGAWQRAVGDFFDGFPGAYLPSAIVLAISVGIFLTRLAWTAARDRALLAGLFVASNLGFFLMHGVLLAVTGWLSRSRLLYPASGFDAGYHRAWPALVVTLLLLTGLLTIQAKVAIHADRRQVG